MTQAVVALGVVNEFTLRVPPALWGTLAVLALWMFVREWGGSALAIVSAYLLALLPFHIAYSQEVRFYSLFTLVAILCVWSFFRLLSAPTRRHWLWYALAHAVGLYTHPFTLILIGLEALAVGWFVFGRGGAGTGSKLSPRAFFARFVGVVALVLLAFMPWILYKVSVGGYAALGGEGAAAVDWTELFKRWDDEIVPPGFYLALGLTGLGAAWLAGRRRVQAAVLLGIVLLAPPAVLVLDSVAQYPFARRQILFAVPFLLVVLAAGLLAVARFAARRVNSQRAIWTGAVAVVLLAALTWWTLPGLARYYATPKEDWRGVGALLVGNVRPGETVVAPLVRQYIAYYAPRLASGMVDGREAGVAPARLEAGNREWVLVTSYFQRTPGAGAFEAWLGRQTALRVNDERRLQLYYVGGGTPADLEGELETRDLPSASWASLGRALYARSEWPVAVRALNRAQALDPTEPSTLFYLGAAYARSGNIAPARANLTRFLELEPAAPESAQARQLLQSLPAQ